MRQKRFCLLMLSFIFVLSGCVVRTYKVTKERLDQDLELGNRGYLEGESTEVGPPAQRKRTRTIQNIEIELFPPIKFEKTPKPKPVQRPRKQLLEGEVIEPEYITPATLISIEKYTVQQGDTLEKISKKFYGTTKKWSKIYKANKAILPAPDKIYPGQIIDIPVEIGAPSEAEEKRPFK